MLTPQNLLRIVVELLFVLLGSLIIWLGLTSQILFDRRRAPWMILSVALILWGLRALWGRGQWWNRIEHWTRGLSLTILGLVMLAISRAPFAYVGRLMAAAGAVLVLRGLLNSVLVLRPR
jgi:hypothetical protein